MIISWADRDIATGAFRADLGEFGDFEAFLDAPVRLVDYGRRLEVPGVRRYLPNGAEEPVEEEITLHVDLEEPLDPAEAAGMTAGEVFSRAWENFTF